MELESALKQALSQTCSAAQLSWIETTLLSLADISENNLDDLYIALAMAGRQAGAELLSISELNLFHWRQSDAARILFLLQLKQHANFQAIVESAYRGGDEAEREAILKGLYWLDNEGKMVELALDACRTNIGTMMLSIASINQYPAKFFGEHEFNQMVLKCLFMNFSIEGVVGLSKRRNPSLSRMCMDYIRERLAADRDTPPTIWLAIRLSDFDDSEALLHEFLAQDSQAHRYQLIVSVSQDIKTWPSVLAAHAQQEESTEIQHLIAEIQKQ